DDRVTTTLGSAVNEEVLRLDDSAGLAPLGVGWDAEPVVLDWFGRGTLDLLVSAGGGPSGRFARIYRALPAADDRPARYDAGEPVEGLDGLRCLCPVPNRSASRFDLVALAPEGLVLLRNIDQGGNPRFGPRQFLGIATDLGIGPGRISQIVADDWDGDGKTDLL